MRRNESTHLAVLHHPAMSATSLFLFFDSSIFFRRSCRAFGGIHAVVPSLPTTPGHKFEGHAATITLLVSSLSNNVLQPPARYPQSELSGFPSFL